MKAPGAPGTAPRGGEVSTSEAYTKVSGADPLAVVPRQQRAEPRSLPRFSRVEWLPCFGEYTSRKTNTDLRWRAFTRRAYGGSGQSAVDEGALGVTVKSSNFAFCR